MNNSESKPAISIALLESLDRYRPLFCLHLKSVDESIYLYRRLSGPQEIPLYKFVSTESNIKIFFPHCLNEVQILIDSLKEVSHDGLAYISLVDVLIVMTCMAFGTLYDKARYFYRWFHVSGYNLMSEVELTLFILRFANCVSRMKVIGRIDITSDDAQHESFKARLSRVDGSIRNGLTSDDFYEWLVSRPEAKAFSQFRLLFDKLILLLDFLRGRTNSILDLLRFKEEYALKHSDDAVPRLELDKRMHSCASGAAGVAGASHSEIPQQEQPFCERILVLEKSAHSVSLYLPLAVNAHFIEHLYVKREEVVPYIYTAHLKTRALVEAAAKSAAAAAPTATAAAAAAAGTGVVNLKSLQCEQYLNYTSYQHIDVLRTAGVCYSKVGIRFDVTRLNAGRRYVLTVYTADNIIRGKTEVRTMMLPAADAEVEVEAEEVAATVEAEEVAATTTSISPSSSAGAAPPPPSFLSNPPPAPPAPPLEAAPHSIAKCIIFPNSMNSLAVQDYFHESPLLSMEKTVLVLVTGPMGPPLSTVVPFKDLSNVIGAMRNHRVSVASSTATAASTAAAGGASAAAGGGVLVASTVLDSPQNQRALAHTVFSIIERHYYYHWNQYVYHLYGMVQSPDVVMDGLLPSNASPCQVLYYPSDCCNTSAVEELVSATVPLTCFSGEKSRRAFVSTLKVLLDQIVSGYNLPLHASLSLPLPLPLPPPQVEDSPAVVATAKEVQQKEEEKVDHAKASVSLNQEQQQQQQPQRPDRRMANMTNDISHRIAFENINFYVLAQQQQQQPQWCAGTDTDTDRVRETYRDVAPRATGGISVCALMEEVDSLLLASHEQRHSDGHDSSASVRVRVCGASAKMQGTDSHHLQSSLSSSSSSSLHSTPAAVPSVPGRRRMQRQCEHIVVCMSTPLDLLADLDFDRSMAAAAAAAAAAANAKTAGSLTSQAVAGLSSGSASVDHNPGGERHRGRWEIIHGELPAFGAVAPTAAAAAAAVPMTAEGQGAQSKYYDSFSRGGGGGGSGGGADVTATKTMATMSENCHKHTFVRLVNKLFSWMEAGMSVVGIDADADADANAEGGGGDKRGRRRVTLVSCGWPQGYNFTIRKAMRNATSTEGNSSSSSSGNDTTPTSNYVEIRHENLLATALDTTIAYSNRNPNSTFASAAVMRSASSGKVAGAAGAAGVRDGRSGNRKVDRWVVPIRPFGLADNGNSNGNSNGNGNGNGNGGKDKFGRGGAGGYTDATLAVDRELVHESVTEQVDFIQLQRAKALMFQLEILVQECGSGGDGGGGGGHELVVEPSSDDERVFMLINDVTGSVLVSDCQRCPAGKFAEEEGMSACKCVTPDSCGLEYSALSLLTANTTNYYENGIDFSRETVPYVGRS